MSFTDKEIICRDCGTAFVWSAGEQEFFAEKGLVNTPTRCPICRKKKEVKHTFQTSYEITCSECGKKSKSPIKPPENTKILCQNCFDKKDQENTQNSASTQLADASATESSY